MTHGDIIRTRLNELGIDGSKINIINIGLNPDQNFRPEYVTYEYTDKSDSNKGGHIFWEVDLILKKKRHRYSNVGASWTNWEDI